jgi:hypothetical protein
MQIFKTLSEKCAICVVRASSMGSQNFQTISASYKTRKPTFLVELENGHYDYV